MLQWETRRHHALVRSHHIPIPLAVRHSYKWFSSDTDMTIRLIKWQYIYLDAFHNCPHSHAFRESWKTEASHVDKWVLAGFVSTHSSCFIRLMSPKVRILCMASSVGDDNILYWGNLFYAICTLRTAAAQFRGKRGAKGGGAWPLC